MKPGVDHHLMVMAGTLATKIIPAIPEGNYAQGDATITAMLAVLMAQEADRAADTLIRENAAMRAVFRAAAGQVSGDLAARVAEAAAGDEVSFRVSALEHGNGELKQVLIDLQTAIELDEEPALQGLNRAIWALLHQGANDRLLMIPPA